MNFSSNFNPIKGKHFFSLLLVDFFSFHVHFVFAPFVSKLFENMNGNGSKIKDEK